ncbi:MAG: glycosyltransferase [Planctomycetaceae bacterium]|jgi:hypothetical protein|nr:glycosyltransferase [Planctomycetaceae bacterium]
MKISTPIRVLQIFGVLSRAGGAEKWILDLLQLHDPRVRFDFLLSVDDGLLVPEVRRLGSTVYLVPFSRSPLPWSWGNPYLSGVREVLHNNRYDVVHVHQFDLSGEILRIAAQEQVPVRVMSVHAAKYENPRFYRRLVHRIYGRPYIFRYATDILPCSRTVAEFFLPSAPKFQTATPKIQHSGIDFVKTGIGFVKIGRGGGGGRVGYFIPEMLPPHLRKPTSGAPAWVNNFGRSWGFPITLLF